MPNRLKGGRLCLKFQSLSIRKLDADVENGVRESRRNAMSIRSLHLVAGGGRASSFDGGTIRPGGTIQDPRTEDVFVMHQL